MPWGYAAAAGAAIVGSSMQAGAASDAADTQAAATNRATDIQAAQADRAYADQAPYRAAGTQALGHLQTDINAPVTSADVMSDPGYEFGAQQGQLALDRKSAAAGGRISGAALKSAAQYATDYATTGYGAAYQRRQDRLNRLASLAGIGQTSTANSAAAGANSANAISNLLSSQGNASGAARLAQGNIWGNAANQLGAIGQRWASQPTTYAGFNGNSSTGYTYQNPETVGPQMP